MGQPLMHNERLQAAHSALLASLRHFDARLRHDVTGATMAAAMARSGIDGAPASRRQIWIHLLLYPGHTLPTAAAPVLVAGGLAWHDQVFAAVPLLLAFLGSWLIHVAGVLADNHELLRRHPDIAEHPELLRALADGTLTLRALRCTIAGCLVAAVAAGAYPVWLGGVPALVLGAVGVLASLGYAAGPRPYARAGCAEPLFLAMFGVVAVVGAYGVQAAAMSPGFSWASLPLSVWVIGLPVGCLVTMVLFIDDIRDREFDARKGWRTATVRHGVHWARLACTGLVCAAYLLPLWFWLGLGLGSAVLLPCLSAPLAAVILRAVWRHDRSEELLAMTPRASLLSMAYAALLAAGLAS